MVVICKKIVHEEKSFKRNGQSFVKHVHDENPLKKMDSHLQRNVHDENPYTLIWIVIRTNMYMTKTHPNMDSHSYKHVHDENHTKTYVNMDIQSTNLYMTKHTTELISTRKMMKFH